MNAGKKYRISKKETIRINREIEMVVFSVDKNRDQVLEEAETSGNSL
jgi:hypothetical protein